MPRRGVPGRQHPAGVLLEQARQGLVDAECAAHPIDRYTRAHLAALRAAAAVLACRGRRGRRSRPASVWELLPKVAPEFAEWSAYFAATSGTRAAAEAGVSRLVPADAANDLVRQAGQFISRVEQSLRGPSR